MACAVFSSVEVRNEKAAMRDGGFGKENMGRTQQDSFIMHNPDDAAQTLNKDTGQG